MAQDIDNVRLEEFAYAVLILGDQIAASAEAVGWTAAQGYKIRHSPEWQTVRARLLKQYKRGRAHRFKEMEDILEETAYAGALNLHSITTVDTERLAAIREAAGDIDVVARVSNQALDRIGMKAPERSVVDNRHSLTPESVELLKVALNLPTVDLADSDYTYALGETGKDAKDLELESQKIVGTK